MRTPATGPRIDAALNGARRRLAAAPFLPSTREASLLLAHVLGVSEVAVLAHGERPLDARQLAAFDDLLERRLAGEPYAYLTGRREFFGLDFLVDARVLVPRPESEHLIEAVLDLDLPEQARVLDVGTGSGCLGLTLAHQRSGWRVTATDRSTGALAVASANRRRLGLVDRVELVAADLTGPLELDRFDLVVSNPPYIATADSATLSPEVSRFEPGLALFAPGDGTSIARRLLGRLQALPGGAFVALEIGFGQADPVERAAAGLGFRTVEIRPDYAGIPRIVVLERRG